jgi:hypothetical protein
LTAWSEIARALGTLPDHNVHGCVYYGLCFTDTDLHGVWVRIYGVNGAG